MVHNQREDLERMILALNIIGPFTAGLLAFFVFENFGQSVYVYQNSSLSSDFLTVYGILFGALMVVIALISPRGDGVERPGDRKEFNSVLDRIFLIEMVTFLLILNNVGSLFPDAGSFLYLSIIVQLAGFPWLFTSVTSILMKLRLYFLV